MLRNTRALKDQAFSFTLRFCGASLSMTKTCSNKAARIYPSARKGKICFLLITKLAIDEEALGADHQIQGVEGGAVWVDRMKHKRNMQTLLKADDMAIVQILTDDGLLPDWSQMHRCTTKTCHKFVLPEHLQPIFTTTPRPEDSLGVQASALLLRLANVPLSAIHLVLGVNHKALNRNLDLVRKGYAEETQKGMSFGGKTKTCMKVEADEALFDKCLLPAEEAPTLTWWCSGSNGWLWWLAGGLRFWSCFGYPRSLPKSEPQDQGLCGKMTACRSRDACT